MDNTQHQLNESEVIENEKQYLEAYNYVTDYIKNCFRNGTNISTIYCERKKTPIIYYEAVHNNRRLLINLFDDYICLTFPENADPDYSDAFFKVEKGTVKVVNNGEYNFTLSDLTIIKNILVDSNGSKKQVYNGKEMVAKIF